MAFRRTSIVLAGLFACSSVYLILRFLPGLIGSSCIAVTLPGGSEFGKLDTLLRNLQADAGQSAAVPTALIIRQLNQSVLKGITPTTIVGCIGCPCDLCWLLGLNIIGEFSPIESAVYQYILRGRCGQQEKLVIDVGGNIGYFTLLAAAYGCRVAVFEPQQGPREMMVASLSLNAHGKHVQVYPYAIGSAEGTGHTVRANVWGRGGVQRTTGAGAVRHLQAAAGSSSDSLHNYSRAKHQPVEFRTLDSVVKEDALLYKIDTEGYETNVMAGSFAYLRKHVVQNIVVEVKAQNTKPKRELLRRVLHEARMTHVYCFFEDYYHKWFHQKGSRLKGYLHDVTKVVQDMDLNTTLFGEEFWFTRTRLDLESM